MPSCFTAKGHTLSFHYLNTLLSRLEIVGAEKARI